ncbi:MAG: hypothetical protein WBD20_13070 [Pirellulaceae bacterium]
MNQPKPRIADAAELAREHVSQMDPDGDIQDIDQLQLASYRRMTGEQRLRIGLGLFDASVDIAREGIRNRFPHASEAEVEEKLRARIRAGYQIESTASKAK